MKKILGFTLAEVLITLGVIGVVAALTIPTLISNHRNKQLAVQAQKVYSTVSQAILKAKADYGVDNLSDTDILDNRKNYLNIVKTGTTNNNDFPSYSWLNSSAVSIESLPCKSGNGTCTRTYDTLNDGSIIIWDSSNSDRDVYTSVIVDANGFKKPNQVGRDVFYFAITKDGRTLPYGTPGLMVDGAHGFGDYTPGVHHGHTQYNDCNISGTGIGCAARLMQNGWTMDY